MRSAVSAHQDPTTSVPHGPCFPQARLWPQTSASAAPRRRRSGEASPGTKVTISGIQNRALDPLTSTRAVIAHTSAPRAPAERVSGANRAGDKIVLRTARKRDKLRRSFCPDWVGLLSPSSYRLGVLRVVVVCIETQA